MHGTDVSARVREAMTAARLTQRDTAAITGISQATLSRIVSGERAAKLPELILIAEATGVPLRHLTGNSVQARAQFAARGTNGSSMEQMRNALVMYLELDAYLTDQAIG